MQSRLNAYRVMWLFVFFDLPTNTKKERKAASQFRKRLLQDGFSMMQFSVYMRHCASLESAKVHSKRVGSFVPQKGKISILKITDKQFGLIENFFGQLEQAPLNVPRQLEMF